LTFSFANRHIPLCLMILLVWSYSSCSDLVMMTKANSPYYGTQLRGLPHETELSQKEEFIIDQCKDDPPVALQSIFIVKAKAGLCHNIMHILLHIVLFTTFGRNFMVDTSLYDWFKWNDTVGFLTGYFQPEFEVVDHPGHYPLVERRYGLVEYKKRHLKKKWVYNYPDPEPVRLLIERLHSSEPSKTPHPSVLVTGITNYTFPLRDQWFPDNGDPNKPQMLFNRMVAVACQHLYPFNARALSSIRSHQAKFDLPDFLGENVISAAFHIRRGDKISWHESPKYPGEQYVEKLINATESKMVDHCFVASDDFLAVQEIQHALHRFQVKCSIHHMTELSERGFDAKKHKREAHAHDTSIIPQKTLAFMSQVDIMIHATYFIGAFNSNVVEMVTLQRKCVKKHTDADPMYANVHGVDRAAWYMR